MTLDKFIKVHNTKTFLKILTIVIVLTLFFFTLNLDFQDYIDGFSRLKRSYCWNDENRSRG